METWKSIIGYPNYEVSSIGTVRSLRYGGRILKACPSNFGYLYVNLIHNKKVKSTAVHKLVMIHFGESQKNQDDIVDHIDGDKTNNRVDNLQWISIRDNTLKYYGNGDKKSKILELRKQGWTYQKISEAVGLCTSTVQQHIVANLN